MGLTAREALQSSKEDNRALVIFVVQLPCPINNNCILDLFLVPGFKKTLDDGIYDCREFTLARDYSWHSIE